MLVCNTLKSFTLGVLLTMSMPASARTITVKNSCSATIWPAYYGSGTGGVTLDDGSPAPSGWQLNKAQSTDLIVPEDCEVTSIPTSQNGADDKDGVQGTRRGSGHEPETVRVMSLGA